MWWAWIWSELHSHPPPPAAWAVVITTTLAAYQHYSLSAGWADMIEVYCSGLRPALIYKVSALRLKPSESRRGYFIVKSRNLRHETQLLEWEIRSSMSHPRSSHFAPHLTTFDNKVLRSSWALTATFALAHDEHSDRTLRRLRHCEVSCWRCQ